MLSLICFIGLIKLAISRSDCQYFEYFDPYSDMNVGPAIPCGVCMNGKITNDDSAAYQGPFSYQFICESTDVKVQGWEQSDCPSSTPSISNIVPNITSQMIHANGGICNHVTFRTYGALKASEE